MSHFKPIKVSGPTEKWSQRDTDTCWVNLRSLMMSKKENVFPDYKEALFDKLLFPKENVIHRPTENIEETKEYLSLAFSSKLHPLGYLMSILGKSVFFCYVSFSTVPLFFSPRI